MAAVRTGRTSTCRTGRTIREEQALGYQELADKAGTSKPHVIPSTPGYPRRDEQPRHRQALHGASAAASSRSSNAARVVARAGLVARRWPANRSATRRSRV